MSEGAPEPGVLNLAGADMKGFDPIPAGRYDAIISRAEWKYSEGGPEAKMPAGTPRLNIGFIVDGGEYDGRWVWTGYNIPPADYDEAKAAKMKGMLVRFLMACGYSEEEVTSGTFEPDLEELLEKEVSVQVTVDRQRDQNRVTTVRPRSEAAVATGDGGLL